MRERFKTIVAVILMMSAFLVGCGAVWIDNLISDIKGELVGNKYTITTYDNYGEKNLTISGDRILVTGNVVKESGVSSGGSITTVYGLSSVLTINIDGHEIESCGDTMIFAGDGLEPVIDFSIENVSSNSSGSISELTSVSRVINRFKNDFGKSRVVVIKSQMGTPICVFEGDDVYWEIPGNLPKMTKLMVDGKPLYIHRANYQIIDKALIE